MTSDMTIGTNAAPAPDPRVEAAGSGTEIDMAEAKRSTGTVRRALPVRRVRFSYPTGTTRQHFVDGDLVMSHFTAVLSSMFPEGEAFFIRAVRDHRDQIDDPELAEQIKGFIGQEVTHSREHRTLNERLQEMGYPTARVDRHIGQLLRVMDRVLSRKAALAGTAALEHYTATFAEILLSDAQAQAWLGDSAVRPVLLWHALEEAEHKAVAFDVYRAAGGSEALRIATMELATAIFWTEVVVQTARSMLSDPATYNPVRLVRSLNHARKVPFFGWKAIRRYNSYNRIGFHPDDWDATDLIDRWIAELFGTADGETTASTAAKRTEA